MKKIIFLLTLAIFINSCGGEDELIKTKLEYSINGEIYKSIGYAYRYDDYESNKLKRYVYIIQSLKSEIIYIEAIDSTFQKNTFIFPEFKFKYSIIGESLKDYEAISGRFTILENKSGVITGEFGGAMLNKYDVSDTLRIENGSFEISLQTYKRTF